MIAIVPEIPWAFNNADELPTNRVLDGQIAINRDTGECFIFDLETKTWKKL